MSSRFGTVLTVSTFGESHGKGIGAILEGCPPGMPLDETDIQPQLDRRRPGQSTLTTARKESDTVVILSGVENSITLGTPIGLLVTNADHRPGDYGSMRRIPRPSHADYTYEMKYGIRATSGGGRASARETIGRVAAGAIAEKFLRLTHGVEIVAWVSAIHTVDADLIDAQTVTRSAVDASPVRCPDPAASHAMAEVVARSKAEKDSVGGVITCVCRNVPPGWGEPVFDKLEARLAQAMLSIPAAKGFEIGSGFAGAKMRGSVHNDLFCLKNDRLGTTTNHSGGIQGGISNGEPIFFRVAFKPTATIGLAQHTVDFDGQPVTLEAKGRHDPCVAPRAVPIVEAMAALVLGDAALQQKKSPSPPSGLFGGEGRGEGVKIGP
ncbi:chorismate synthase [Desulfosarcina sp. OttesenSCG-928-G10]|nr:chorismate synthase [Desulfosarcina sp. OttesenSCG-928-G10]MDL2322257.1 chorismate synthase [Desulfosarcina sp. OttesenSCG-928-B08]